jgi:hypothetical protein
MPVHSTDGDVYNFLTDEDAKRMLFFCYDQQACAEMGEHIIDNIIVPHFGKPKGNQFTIRINGKTIRMLNYQLSPMGIARNPDATLFDYRTRNEIDKLIYILNVLKPKKGVIKTNKRELH